MREILLQKVCKAYGGQPVLQGFSALFGAGETVALLGPSGAGKTTLARLLLGLEKPDSGQMRGLDQRFGCVFQENRLCPTVSAAENLRLVLPRRYFGLVGGALAVLGLDKEAQQKPSSVLSGGQKRRVALARAVLFPSTVLLLDEPFKGLDKENKKCAYDFIQKNRQGRTLILISHEESEAAALGARCLRLPQPGQRGVGENKCL